MEISYRLPRPISGDACCDVAFGNPRYLHATLREPCRHAAARDRAAQGEGGVTAIDYLTHQ